MTNSVDPDQMASLEDGSGSTLFAKVGVVVNSRIRINPCHAEYIKMPCPLLIFSQSHYLIRVFDRNSDF